MSAANTPTLSAIQGREAAGTWPTVCRQRAFVDGAKWWEYESRKATMWPSDRDKAEMEAVRRYGQPGIGQARYWREHRQGEMPTGKIWTGPGFDQYVYVVADDAPAEYATPALPAAQAIEGLELEVRQYLSGLVVPDNPLSARYKGRGAIDLLTDCLSHIRVLTERAERAEASLGETFRDPGGTVWTRPTAYAYSVTCGALRGVKDEVAALRRHDAVECERLSRIAAAVGLAEYGGAYNPDSVLPRVEALRAQLSALTASLAAERERALRWAFDDANPDAAQHYSDVDGLRDIYVARGLAALDAKGGEG